MKTSRLLTCALFLLPLCSGAATLGGPDVREVASGIMLLPGQLQADRSPDGNSVIVRGPTGMLVVDSGRGGTHTRNLVAVLHQLHLPLEAVVNTHWHLDHIGGNPLLRHEFPEARIYAHPSMDTALEGFHAESRARLEAQVQTLPPDSPELSRWNSELDLLRNADDLVAGEKVRDAGRWTFGGREVERHIAAHAVTEGDLWLFDPKTRTLIAGDLVTLPVPLFDTACPETWVEALNTLGTQDFKLLIPGHGAPLNPVQFKQYRKAFGNLLSCAADKKKKKRGDDQTCIDGWLRDAGSLVGPRETEYSKTLLAYYLGNNLRLESPGRQRWCS